MPDQQSPVASQHPARGYPPVFGPNGFDFGLSDSDAGLGYGLLGNLSWLKAGQNCQDCAPSAPCASCDGSSDDGVNSGLQLTELQAIPMPWFPLPPITTTPSQPSPPLVIGDPNAWWNWTPGEIANWINGPTQAQPTQEVEEMCEEQYARDTINCNLKKAYAGTARVCHEQAAQAYADCLKNGKKSDIPRYDRK